MRRKLTSRKFWAAVAAFLLSLSNSIAGLASGNQKLVTVGTICGVLSAAIYAFSEAYVDAAHAGNTQNDISEDSQAIGFEVQGEEQEEE